MFSHISFEKLADLAEGLASAADRTESMKHLAHCAGCAQKLAKLESAISLMRVDHSEMPPRDVVSNTIGMFASRAAQPTSVIDRIVAALSFDSFQTRPAFAVRSAKTTAIRQLVFAAGAYDLDLRVTARNDICQLTGQVLGKRCAEGDAIELKSDSYHAVAPLNPECQFAFHDVPNGTYSLHVKFDDLEIEIPEFKLEA